MERLLEGVRVIDLTRMLSGPYATSIMADSGAEVIKVETPGGGDPMREMHPRLPNGTSAYFISINRNKKSLTLNLKTRKGRSILYSLAKASDVVVDNFRPSVMEKLGLDYLRLREVNPRIVCCSITAFGESGPYRDLPAFDLILQALSGAMSITGEPDRTPVRMGIPMGDLAGALFAAQAVGNALYKREKTGKGCRITVSLLDTMVHLLTYVAQYYFTDGKVPGPIGSGHQTVVPYQAFKTRDIFIVVAVFVEKFWENFCLVLGLEHLIRDPRFQSNAERAKNREELIPILEARFLQKPGEEWLAELRDASVPCAPIHTLDRTTTDPQVLHNRMVVDMDIPYEGTVKTLGNPTKVEGAEEIFLHPPLLGEHNDEILKTLLGYSAEEIASFRREGVI